MADLTVRQGDSLDSSMKMRYHDLGSAVYALVVAADILDGGEIDIIDRVARELGVVRIESTYDGSTFVSPRLDASTYAANGIDYAHHEVHGGSAYGCHYRQLVSDVNDRTIITFRTPDTDKHLHMIWSFSVSGPSEISVLEAPTVTNNTGAVLAIYNHDRNSANTSGAWDTSQNPDVQGQATYFTEATMGSVSGGTEIDGEYLASGARNFTGGGSGRGVTERMLKRNTLYAFEITSLTNDDNYCSIELDWYEHTPKS